MNDAGEDGDAGERQAQARFELGQRLRVAGNLQQMRGQALVRRRAAADNRLAFGDLKSRVFHRHQWAQSFQKLRGAQGDLRGCHANHRQHRNSVSIALQVIALQVGGKRRLQRGDG